MVCVDEQWGFCFLFEHLTQFKYVLYNATLIVKAYLSFHQFINRSLATTQLTTNVLSSFKTLSSSSITDDTKLTRK